jgi:hypothetical protein
MVIGGRRRFGGRDTVGDRLPAPANAEQWPEAEQLPELGRAVPTRPCTGTSPWLGTGQGHREDPPDRAQPVAHRPGPQPEPIAGLIDSRSVKGAATAGGQARGYDAGKNLTAPASGSSSPTPSACSSPSRSAPPDARTATARRQFRSPPTSRPQSGSSSPTADSPDVCSTGRRPSCAPPSRSCANPPVNAGMAFPRFDGFRP